MFSLQELPWPWCLFVAIKSPKTLRMSLKRERCNSGLRHCMCQCTGKDVIQLSQFLSWQISYLSIKMTLNHVTRMFILPSSPCLGFLWVFLLAPVKPGEDGCVGYWLTRGPAQTREETSNWPGRCRSSWSKAKCSPGGCCLKYKTHDKNLTVASRWTHSLTQSAPFLVICMFVLCHEVHGLLATSDCEQKAQGEVKNRFPCFCWR